MNIWEKRCYFNGIPDDILPKLIDSGRVPSYKAIALAILKNDNQLLSLGFIQKNSNYYYYYKNIEHEKNDIQLNLFG